MRVSRYPAVLGLLLGLAGIVAASELVGVRGSNTQFPTRIEVAVEGKPVPMFLTGAALRTRYLFNVYTVASYLQTGANVKTAEALMQADVPKRLQIVMERDVTGADMADAMKSAIRANHAEPAFNAEVANLVEQLKVHSLRKGDTIVLTHVPSFGLLASIVGKGDFVIKNPNFSRAVWEIYLGSKPVTEEIKANLTNRL